MASVVLALGAVNFWLLAFGMAESIGVSIGFVVFQRVLIGLLKVLRRVFKVFIGLL